jgi:hypothetical protein
MRVATAGVLAWAWLGVTATVVLARGEFADFIMRESWSGLAGAVTVDAQEAELPSLLWELVIPEKRRFRVVAPLPIEPRDRRKYATSQPRPTDWPIADDVLLRVRGKDVRFNTAPRRTRLFTSDFDGRWLSVGERPESAPLTLLKEKTAASSWRVHAGQQAIWRKDRGRDGFQFEVTVEAQWKLESAQHPGWFLGRRKDRLVLVPDIADATVIEFSQQRFFDDLTDGK